MKKILVVDDTQVNLDAAKAFFSTITDFEFVYATNRKDAAGLLEEVDALITDRSLPWTQSELFNCKMPKNIDEIFIDIYLQHNGMYLLMKACLLNKPAILATDHGSFDLMYLRNESGCREDASLHELMLQMEKNATNNTYWEFGRHPRTTQDFSVQRHKDLSKVDSNAWQLAWEELLKKS